MTYRLYGTRRSGAAMVELALAEIGACQEASPTPGERCLGRPPARPGSLLQAPYCWPLLASQGAVFRRWTTTWKKTRWSAESLSR